MTRHIITQALIAASAFTVFTLAELNFADAAIADGAAASTVKALAAIKACVIICRVMRSSFG